MPPAAGHLAMTPYKRCPARCRHYRTGSLIEAQAQSCILTVVYSQSAYSLQPGVGVHGWSGRLWCWPNLPARRGLEPWRVAAETGCSDRRSSQESRCGSQACSIAASGEQRCGNSHLQIGDEHAADSNATAHLFEWKAVAHLSWTRCIKIQSDGLRFES